MAICTVLFEKFYAILRYRAQKARDNQLIFQNDQKQQLN